MDNGKIKEIIGELKVSTVRQKELLLSLESADELRQQISSLSLSQEGMIEALQSAGQFSPDEAVLFWRGLLRRFHHCCNHPKYLFVDESQTFCCQCVKSFMITLKSLVEVVRLTEQEVGRVVQDLQSEVEARGALAMKDLRQAQDNVMHRRFPANRIEAELREAAAASTAKPLFSVVKEVKEFMSTSKVLEAENTELKVENASMEKRISQLKEDVVRLRAQLAAADDRRISQLKEDRAQLAAADDRRISQLTEDVVRLRAQLAAADDRHHQQQRQIQQLQQQHQQQQQQQQRLQQQLQEAEELNRTLVAQLDEANARLERAKAAHQVEVNRLGLQQGAWGDAPSIWGPQFSFEQRQQLLQLQLEQQMTAVALDPFYELWPLPEFDAPLGQPLPYQLGAPGCPCGQCATATTSQFPDHFQPTGQCATATTSQFPDLPTNRRSPLFPNSPLAKMYTQRQSGTASQDGPGHTHRCAQCARLITSSYKRVMNKSFHPECWRCADCNVVLEKAATFREGIFLCKPCAKGRPPA